MLIPSHTALSRFKIERVLEEDQERAYIIASRRSDRGFEARIESARRASEIHRRRTGRWLVVTEQAVINEETYEAEDDHSPFHPTQYNQSRGRTPERQCHGSFAGASQSGDSSASSIRSMIDERMSWAAQERSQSASRCALPGVLPFSRGADPYTCLGSPPPPPPSFGFSACGHAHTEGRPPLHLPGKSVPLAGDAGLLEMMTLETSSGTVQLPVDVEAALRVADEQRRRNMSASARFRQRSREKKREIQSTIAGLKEEVRSLQAKLDGLTRDAARYKRERDDCFQELLQLALQRQELKSRSSLEA